MFENIRTILWDFDGVILDSMPVREEGFRLVLSEYSGSQVESLIRYHRKNGGLSRYVKFRYFFENILGRDITKEEVGRLADTYSAHMLEKLPKKELLIRETLDFIQRHADHYGMHLVSGSDQKELRKLCHLLNIDHFFRSIHGSPAWKGDLVRQILENYGYKTRETLLIGDSINDFDAATENGILFMGINNPDLLEVGDGYITSLQEE